MFNKRELLGAPPRLPVRGVRLLGYRGRIAFQTDQALVVGLPVAVPTRHASAFAISFA